MRWDTFHVLGISSPHNCSSLYAPPPASSRIRYGSSQLAENFPSFFLALLAILQTMSPVANDLGHRFTLYFQVARCLTAKLRIWAFSTNLDWRSRWVVIFWWFLNGSYSSRCRDGSPISTGIMASVPYTRLNGDSLVDDWGGTPVGL